MPSNEPASKQRVSTIMNELDALVSLAEATPAWVERHLAAAAALIEHEAADAVTPHDSAALATLTSMFDTVPQVVGVDASASLTRAEWVDECLLITISFDEPDPDRRTMFRIVRAEPRVWYQTGIDGATNEITQSAVIVRLPCVDGDLEFVPGSY